LCGAEGLYPAGLAASITPLDRSTTELSSWRDGDSFPLSVRWLPANWARMALGGKRDAAGLAGVRSFVSPPWWQVWLFGADHSAIEPCRAEPGIILRRLEGAKTCPVLNGATQSVGTRRPGEPAARLANGSRGRTCCIPSWDGGILLASQTCSMRRSTHNQTDDGPRVRGSVAEPHSVMELVRLAEKARSLLQGL
jgi:hypothetical protein